MNKYLFSPLKQRFLSLGVSQGQVEEWAAKWKTFFILGLGRSGTEFMSSFLNKANGAYVFHEPVFEDFNAYVKAFYSSHDAEIYIQKFRMKEIYLRMRHSVPGVYGEVNGALRRHAPAIKSFLPNTTLIHLVRDGRDVVRSLMSRGTMTMNDPFNIRIHPVETDPWKSEWNGMDRFSRLCWLWQVDNGYLRTTIGRIAQFEKILNSYEYFYREILNPCHINIEKKIWEAAVSAPRNMTSKFKISKWEDWTPEQQKIFRKICGDEMEKCGYEF